MTEEQRSKVPYESWWENNRKGKENIQKMKEQKQTIEEIIAWQRKIDKEAGIKNDFLENSILKQNEKLNQTQKP